jgi:O-antigen/teichoic acid export membrane protein
MPCRALAGSAVMIQQSGVLVRPRLRPAEVKGLYRFGARVQGVALVSFARDQGVNLAAAAIGGVGVLGLLSFAQRLSQPIWLVFDGSWRVSYPTMSRLRDAGRDVGGAAVRALELSAAVTGLAVVGVAAATPALVPSLFGPKWHEVIGVMPFILATLLLGGPILACASGYFTTLGRPEIVLRAELAATAVTVPAAAAGLLLDGAQGLAAGVLAGTLVSTVYLGVRLRAEGVRVLGRLAQAAALAALAAGAGWACAQALGASLWSAAVAGLVGVTIECALLLALQRRAALDALRLSRRALPRRAAG